MRSWGKIFVGILAALVLFCIIGGFLLMQSGALDRMKEFGGGVMDISQNAKGLETLDKKFPFQEPPDGALSEDRLLAYIGVRKALKPVADTYDEWMKAHEGNEGGDFKEAREVIRLTGDVMESFRKALEAQKMCPREYSWLDRKVKDALSQSGSGSASEMERDLLQTLRKTSENPRLTPEERQEIRAKVEEAESRLGGKVTPPTPDAALCARHRIELEETALGELSGQMVRGFANSPRGHHRRRGEKAPLPGDSPESP